MKLFGCILLIGALIIYGLLCSFLIYLGLNKKVFWEEMENNENEQK